ncbi:unnamed protein product [Darwinula stevensoni]|uniref:chitinase n=1 Tax=Darwinula stevensoni TaxID=69355 RepID=A0A7R9AD20_9CRUS|nr:unnamed protein product [Darwinula stevensoni]CAG0900587.1 unnamed protein product [Darwinula stevensoni]
MYGRGRSGEASLKLDRKMKLALLFLSALLAVEAGPAQKRESRSGKLLVCYYGSWAVYRPGDGKFDVEQIDPTLCTHLVFGFAGLSYENKIHALDPWNELVDEWGSGKDAYRRFNALKTVNPGMKTILAIGGWNEGSTKYSQMAADPAKRATFVTSCVDFLQKYGFDGLDMDWEYPANRGGTPADKVSTLRPPPDANFVQLLRELKAAFRPHGLLLTAAVSAGKSTIDTAYDVPAMAESLDIISVMVYDMHGAWEPFTHHNAPLYAHPLDQSGDNRYFNANYSMRYWLSLGAPREKLVMGMPTYGRGFSLDRPEENGFYAPASQAGMAGPYTREAGILGFNEICEIQKQYGDFQRHWNHDVKVPYCTFNSRQWFGYDDIESISLKAQLIVDLNLAGGMVWSVETDDFRGKCGLGNNPILNAIKRVLDGGHVEATTADSSVTSTTGTSTTSTSAPSPSTTSSGQGECSHAGFGLRITASGHKLPPNVDAESLSPESQIKTLKRFRVRSSKSRKEL